MKLYESLDSTHGHILVLLVLVMLGMAACFYKIPKGEEMLSLSFGALLYSMTNGKVKPATDAVPPPPLSPPPNLSGIISKEETKS